MNYQIIKDIKELEKFIEWLPELKNGQKFYVSLFARNKYKKTEGLKADKCQLKRFTSNKEQLVSKLRKLEVAIGEYEQDGVKINQDSLALYITPNPRDMHKAGLKTIQELTKFLVEGRTIYNAEAVALNMIQVTGIKKYMDFDIDFKEGKGCSLETILNWIRDGDLINIEAVAGNIIKTRGGFHILVELDKISYEYEKVWYNRFTQTKHDTFDVTVNNDNLVPCPGCVQSDFIPSIYSLISKT